MRARGSPHLLYRLIFESCRIHSAVAADPSLESNHSLRAAGLENFFLHQILRRENCRQFSGLTIDLKLLPHVIRRVRLGARDETFVHRTWANAARHQSRRITHARFHNALRLFPTFRRQASSLHRIFSSARSRSARHPSSPKHFSSASSSGVADPHAHH